MSEQPEPVDPVSEAFSNASQEELLRFAAVFLQHHKQAHAVGSKERDAYEASRGLIAMFPQQPWYRRAWGRVWKRLHEIRLRRHDRKMKAGSP